YRSIEAKIDSELKSSAATGRRIKRRRVSSNPTAGQPQPQPRCVSERSISYVALQALIRALDPIQRFPEEVLLQLSCDSGIASIVLWCYYILGVSVLVRISETVVHFGDGPYNITIEACDPGQ